MSAAFTESTVEEAALGWFGDLKYAVAHGPHLAPGEPAAERDSFGDPAFVGLPKLLTGELSLANTEQIEGRIAQ